MRADREAHWSSTKAVSWQWIAGLAVLLAALVFYFSNTTDQGISDGSDRAIIEFVRAELPEQRLLDEPPWMLVEVFNPATGTWKESRKDHVKPGEEFRAMNLLFKQVMYDGLSKVHGEVDLNNMDGAYAAFNPRNVRDPSLDDVVYVLGEPLPMGGFHTLGYLGPNQSFRFQGRVFKTETGSQPDTVRVVDTGKTFAKAGGDPDAKPSVLIRTAYTDKFFPDPKLPKADPTEGDQQ